jgi:hypothetical protein
VGAAKGMASRGEWGSSWVMVSTGRRRGTLAGLGAAAWSARLAYGEDWGNLPCAGGYSALAKPRASGWG